MTDSSPAPGRARPGVVAASFYLLLLFALTQLIGLIATVSVASKLREGFERAFEGTTTGAQDVGTFVVGFTIGTAALLLVLSLVLVVLGVFNNRGSNGTRITTWVLGGILVCCLGGSLISGATGAVGGNTGGDGPSAEELRRSLDDALPSWYTPVNTVLGVLGLLSLLVALILLALPKANEFFRKPKQGWEPPVPGGAYPAEPGYPQTPGYPTTPGYPGQPAPGQPGAAAPGQPGPAGPSPESGERRDGEPPSAS
ncbi:hypothetical protein GCE86_26395 [Micromonospora terminaliae]|uniref:Uncharacterized protein n=1 Tax=Micromonospora terminaliae TaxID=1914461 RepID=A0AAJ2Z9U2_9ACTN|nr:hypothetical protein [Micromonospora terminaliae]NES26035.1 hypothetical protein [Micromonospora terminaliae]QGL50239.1 hypothetical protein GCE86_26395 [Micromonospora terminaliae]